jgi:hypothetical protein
LRDRGMPNSLLHRRTTSRIAHLDRPGCVSFRASDLRFL